METGEEEDEVGTNCLYEPFSLIYPLSVNIEAAIYHRNQEKGNSFLLEYRLLRVLMTN